VLPIGNEPNLFSANTMANDMERGYSFGFVEYLTKPIGIARLLTLVGRVHGEQE
jgi:CheY-like chemotaxis protein